MKRVFFSILALLALVVTPVAKADNITVEQAQDAALHYMQHNAYIGRIQPQDLTLVYQYMNDELNVPSMYVFNLPKDGWIIMAATTVINPVVAFSDVSSFDPQDVAPGAAAFLSSFNELVCDVQAVDAEKGLGKCEAWDKLENHLLTGNTKDLQVQFLQAKWDQGDFDGKIYNMFAPKATSTAPGGYYYCPTGCVATALAQICHYYQFPKKARNLGYTSYSWSAGNTYVLYNGSYRSVSYEAGNGSKRMNFNDSAAFDYSLMPNALTARTREASRREVSRLGWYIGIAVKMSYAPDGSSSNDSKVIENFPNYFKFTTPTYVRRTSSNTTSYMNALRAELLMKRPVYMTGFSNVGDGRDAGGHAFLVGGYMEQDQDMYYMNWGWGGNDDAWYNLRANTEETMYAGGYAFTEGQSIYTNFIPEGDSVSISEVDLDATLGAAYPNPATYSVKIPYHTSNVAELTIYNALGQPVETRRVQAGNGELTVRVDAMPKGIYIYRMGDAYGKFIVR